MLMTSLCPVIRDISNYGILNVTTFLAIRKHSKKNGEDIEINADEFYP